ncbi:MAG: holo-ACP synthase [Sulfurospirillum sp.]|nr:MAG: holo-ACP synthase [Sulfurospirillum sp.]
MIGIDIAKISRFEKFFEKKSLLSKFLSEEEILLVKSTQNVASLFASKEAISKALGVGIGKHCTFKDIRIHKDSLGAPYFTLSKHIIQTYNITETSLSITHDGEYAIAVAVIGTEKEPKRELWH